MSQITQFVLILFLNLVRQEAPEWLDPKNDPSERDVNALDNEYDFIIVGAGSAGSVLASRLSEIKHWKILLIESGGDENVYTRTPLFQKIYKNSSLIWGYSTVYQENACQISKGICNYPTGKMMGGSSSINGMLYARGSRHDYDEWAKMGCKGWSYNQVLPYFIKSEGLRIPHLMNSSYHGTEGPLIVQYAKYLPEITDLIIDAAQELGVPRRDYNGEYLTGVDIPQINVDDSRRCSASTAYLTPVRDRNNLHIAKHSLVHRVLIDETKSAIGVEFEFDGVVKKIFATKEVILSAGAINSPKILMLSGIGPKEHLDNLTIPVLADLPVGKNFQDHVRVNIKFRMNGNFTIDEISYSDPEILQKYTKYKKGLYTYNAFPAMLFFSLGSDIAKDPPDIQVHFIDYSQDRNNQSIVVMTINKTRPQSKGTVLLQSSNPTDPPLIDPRYFNNRKDLKDTIEGLDKTISLLTTKTFSRYEPKLITHPYCSDIQDRLSFLKCIVRYNSETVFHPVGTASMGPRQHHESVVDPELRVIGINKLRVVDASIMPEIISANTNAPTIMIAEKASDVIKSHYNQW